MLSRSQGQGLKLDAGVKSKGCQLNLVKMFGVCLITPVLLLTTSSGDGVHPPGMEYILRGWRLAVPRPC